MVFVPLEKMCRRSVVLGEWDAGTPGGGSCETMVVFASTESIVVVILVEELNWAGTDSYVVVLPFDAVTVTS